MNKQTTIPGNKISLTKSGDHFGTTIPLMANAFESGSDFFQMNIAQLKDGSR